MSRTKARDTSRHAEVFLEYHALLSVDDGPAYRARACGGEARDGTNRWHGWIEFLPQGKGSLVLHTARETTQPDRTCTVYWSTGLTQVYLEGALERALGLVRIRSATDAHVSRPAPADLPTAILRGRARDVAKRQRRE
jgi:hypothetical protein